MAAQSTCFLSRVLDLTDAIFAALKSLLFPMTEIFGGGTTKQPVKQQPIIPYT